MMMNADTTLPMVAPNTTSARVPRNERMVTPLSTMEACMYTAPHGVIVVPTVARTART